jgi:L-threonylcarbamoyladenylate synthase
VAKALVEQFGGPITGTSANLSGFPATASVMDLDPEIRRQVDMVLDAGTLAGGPGSTIVDVTCWPVRVLREGVVPRWPSSMCFTSYGTSGRFSGGSSRR